MTSLEDLITELTDDVVIGDLKDREITSNCGEDNEALCYKNCCYLSLIDIANDFILVFGLDVQGGDGSASVQIYQLYLIVASKST